MDVKAHENIAAAERDIKVHKTRDKWETRLDFDISTLAVGVGLGNVWKLAFVVFENGQGTKQRNLVIMNEKICFIQ